LEEIASMESILAQCMGCGLKTLLLVIFEGSRKKKCLVRKASDIEFWESQINTQQDNMEAHELWVLLG
jgi:hypothetical protein